MKNLAVSCMEKIGSRSTKAKRFLAEVLTTSERPMSAAELLSAAAAKRIRLDKTTVYRFLAAGVLSGELSEVEFGDGVTRYEHTHGAHHHHAVCSDCSTVVELDIEPTLVDLLRRIRSATGFEADRHHVEFFGRCKKCAV